MTLRTASATISSSRQTIMAFVIFSTPFCKPRLHTPKPSTTATDVYKRQVGHGVAPQFYPLALPIGLLAIQRHSILELFLHHIGCLLYTSLQELMNLFKEVADIKTDDQLNLPTPEVEYHNIVAKPTEHQQEMVKALSERASEVHRGSAVFYHSLLFAKISRIYHILARLSNNSIIIRCNLTIIEGKFPPLNLRAPEYYRLNNFCFLFLLTYYPNLFLFL